jgi:tetratricopeptide (TPR) repeat protein
MALQARGSILFALMLAGLSGTAASQNLTADEVECGTFIQSGRLKPEDYRKASPRLKVVEDFHYGPNVEALVRPMQKGMTFGSDLDYTLWGYPNHHRALVTLVRLGAREKTDRPRGTQFTIDCYFHRGLRVASDDVITRMLYADYLGSVNRKADALRQMDLVVRLAEDNGLTHYNAGLVYLQLGEYEKAVAEAHQATRLGMTRPGLQAELQRLGKWTEDDQPPAASDSPASSNAASAASAPGQ